MKKALFIGLSLPEPKATALGWRLMQLIELIKSKGFQIHFASESQNEIAEKNLNRFGVETHQIKLNCNSFNLFCKDLNPEIVVFDRFISEEMFGWRVRESIPKSIQILDTEDLHFLRKSRETQLKNNATEISFNHKETYRELASIYRCDLSLIISNYEYDLLVNHFSIPKERLSYLPFLVDSISESEIEQLPSFEERKNFIFIGTAKHKPNVDAVQYLKSSIWPEIRKAIPNAELEIYGSYWEDKIQNLNDSKNGFLMKGFAENSDFVHQKSRVSLVPLRFGAGLKGKVFDAIKNACPTVLSSIASEGITKDENLIFDHPEQFIKQAIELYTNENLWKANQLQMLDAYNQFDKTNFVSEFNNSIDFLLENLEQIRANNHLRNILTMEEMESKKYLSKWIEEKNKA